MTQQQPQSQPHAGGDALDRELASLKETIGLTNPLTYGHSGDWKTTTIAARDAAAHEAAYARTLPSSFVLTEPRHSLKAFQAAANAARHPAQPLRPPNAGAAPSETGGLRRQDSSGPSPEELALQRRELPPTAVVSAPKRVPMAKRSHMDGILHGIPRDPVPATTTQLEHLEYSPEMRAMNRDKDTSFHRKRDAYSEYVEARARFSKMHSVN